LSKSTLHNSRKPLKVTKITMQDHHNHLKMRYMIYTKNKCKRYTTVVLLHMGIHSIWLYWFFVQFPFNLLKNCKFILIFHFFILAIQCGKYLSILFYLYFSETCTSSCSHYISECTYFSRPFLHIWNKFCMRRYHEVVDRIKPLYEY